ncbi:MAG: hypothetical protein JXB32_25640 [Deltaproteobacteria bacterium]|nr:hypothetical protein [Deltaproteobacteria bacterium]
MPTPAARVRSPRRLLPAVAAVLLAAVAAPATGCRGDREGSASPGVSGGTPATPAATATADAPAAETGAAPETPAPDVVDAPAAPTEPPVPPGPLPASPELTAHLARIPEGPGPHLVARLELGGIIGREELRVVARRMFGLLGAPGDTDAACLAELLGSVSAVTYVWQESDGPDAGIALVDAAVRLPVVLLCLRSLGLPVPAAADAAGDGLLALAPQVSAAPIADGTVAVGATALVRAALAGSPPRPLSQSPALDRARALAGASPAWVALFAPDDSAPSASAVHGGLGLRTAPRLGLTGRLAFADPTRAGALVARATGLLSGLHAAGQAVLGEASRLLPEEDVAPLRAVLDAARDTRFVVDAGTLSFEAWLPPGFTVPELLGALVALAPILDLL